jgi:hypothetical protein
MLVGLLLAAAPAVVLPTIPAPLGHLAGVVGAPNTTGPSSIGYQPDARCEAKAIDVFKAAGGALRAVEQLQAWLEAAPSQQARLFGKKQVLASLFASVSQAELGRLRLKQLPAEVVRAPPDGAAWVEAEPGRGEGDFWLVVKGRPVGLVFVTPSTGDACLPRLVISLFDGKRQVRVRIDATWGGSMTASLVGDGCAAVDFALDEQRQVFVPTAVSRCLK